MSGPNALPKGRVWLGYVEALIGFVLFIAFFLGVAIPALLWISQENSAMTPEQFAAVAVATAICGLLVTSWLAHRIVRGRSYTPEQRRADELRHAEISGQRWLYEYLQNMAPDEAERYERRRQWFSRFFSVSTFTLPAGIALDRPILWFIPAALLAGEFAWTYWRARTQRFRDT